jgi:hypothetical protein
MLVLLMVVTEITEEVPEMVKKPESKVHKSLAEILGIPKRGEQVEQPKVAVVIDPKIAKVLRPHQIEGVKVSSRRSLTEHSSFIGLRQGRFTIMLLVALWQTKWVSERLYSF